MPSNSIIRLVTLAPEGYKKIEWVTQHMLVLNRLRKEYSVSKPFAGLNILARLHIEAPTAVLAILLRDAGAEVTLVEATHLSTQDDVAAALYEEEGIAVIGQYGSPQEEHRKYQRDALESKPHMVIDSGGIMTRLLHNDCCQHLAENYIGSTEETTTGVKRLEAMAASEGLQHPVIAVNNSLSKYLFENLHGTGQSVWSSIMTTTNLVVGGKVAVVIGYGWCGKGIARKGRALGARVIICETDPIKSSEAIMDGFNVMTIEEAVTKGDYIITATGIANVISDKHIPLLKNRAILANAGHANIEIDLNSLYKLAKSTREITDRITQIRLSDDKNVFLLAQGYLVNSAAGDGQPAEVMDVAFALHVLSLKMLIEQKDTIAPEIIRLPREIDEFVTSMFLHGQGVGIDQLTADQKNYFAKFPY